MAIDFPSAPAAGQEYTYNGIVYVFTAQGVWSSTGNYLQADVPTTITVGYKFIAFNAGTKSSGTFTPSIDSGNYQYYTNNGAHTLAPAVGDHAMDILITNGATAGAITFSGFTVGASVGDALTTTNAAKFIIHMERINTVATYVVKALQ